MSQHWAGHRGVRTGSQLSMGERAADRLKAAFGSWPFIIILNLLIVAWVLVQTFMGSAAFDPYPWLLLNIGLSWLAAQQGGALQIAANRGDRISAEVALHTQGNTDKLMDLSSQILTLQQQQMTILTELRHLNAELDLAREARGTGDPREQEETPQETPPPPGPGAHT